MNKWIARAGVTVSLVAMAATMAVADGAKTADAKKAAVMCPICKMPLSATKTKDNTVAVQLKKGDKTMYCCAKCKMPASVLVKAKPAAKAKM